MRPRIIALAGIGAIVVGAAIFLSASKTHTVRVAQSGAADVVGSDSAALQKAAAMLKPGDVLSIGPGTYEMNDSLFVPSNVTIVGEAGKTILKKSPGVESLLSEDGGYGQRTLGVKEPGKFHAGMGIAVMDDLSRGWAVSITSVRGVKDSRVIIEPMTTQDYDQEKQQARIRNIFPIVSVNNAENVVLEDLIVDGDKTENEYLDGCRGGGIYMCQVRNVTVRRCIARNYNGDGISFQISENVKVLDSESYGNAGFGMHPGTGSESSVITDCRMHDNGDVGLFLCYRVRHGRFENNVIQNNGHYGVSIGHMDTDNKFVNNTIARNGTAGVLFRRDNPINSGHRNTFISNKVLDNGNARAGYGFYIWPSAGDLILENNQIAETRKSGGTQRIGIYKMPGTGPLTAKENRFAGQVDGDLREQLVAAK